MSDSKSKKYQPVAESLLDGPVPEEVVLTNPPLKRALAQIRFLPILGINQPDSSMVASFQEAIRVEYPNYQRELESVSLSHGIGGQAESETFLRHMFKDDEQKWEILLTHEFVALSTTAYQTKGEFARKIRMVADAMAKHIKPHRATRLGIRFVGRIDGDDLRDIDKHINPEFLGPYAMFGGKVDLLITEILLSLSDDIKMMARWGCLPPGKPPAPGMDISALDEPSWILDSDIYTGPFPGFIPEEIADRAESMAGRFNAFFRGVFKDEFIRKYGENL